MFNKRKQRFFYISRTLVKALLVFISSLMILTGTAPRIEDQEHQRLLQELKSPDAFTREAAARHLGELKVMSAVEPLIKTLEDGELLIRLAAVQSLKKIGDHRAIFPISQLLKDRESPVQKEALQALKHLGWHPRSPEEKTWDHIINHRWEQVIKLGNAAHAPLLGMLSHNDVVTRKESVWCLGEIGKRKFLEPLSQKLRDKHWLVRYEAVTALGKIGGDIVVMQLEKLLDDPHLEVRRQIVRVAAKLRSNSGIELLQKVRNDSDQTIRALAFTLLKKKGWSPTNISDKVYQLISEEKWIEVMEIGKPAVKPMVEQLKDKNSWIRREAAQILGEIGGSEAIKALLAVYHDQRFLNMEMARESLKTGKKENSKARERGISNDKKKLKPTILESLGKLKAPSLFPILKEILSNRQADINLCGSAVAALGYLKEPRGVELLMKLLGNGRHQPYDRIWYKIFPALKTITGKDFGDTEKKWLEWYRKDRN